MRTALMAFGCAVALAACGSSSSSPGSTSASSGSGREQSQVLAFARCMRSHGVSGFPDPTAGGDIAISPSQAQSPVFQSAQRACQVLLPNKGTPPQMTAGEHAAALRFAECMRTHGAPDFPDPVEPNSSSTSGPILVLKGMQFSPGPGFKPGSPAFRQAAADCGINLPGKQPTGGPAAGP